MNNIKEKGFGLFEIMLSLAILGIITAIAVYSFFYQKPKSQAFEATQMMELQKLNLEKSRQLGTCGSTNLITGKFGVLRVSGTPVMSQGASCPTGCKLTYTFSADTHKSVSRKVIDVQVLGNMKLAKTSATTLDAKFLPTEFGQAQPVAGDNCSALTGTRPTITGGADGGSEIGEVDPNAPVIPPVTPPVTPTDPTPSTPTDPNGGTTTPTPTPTPTPSGEVVADTISKAQAFGRIDPHEYNPYTNYQDMWNYLDKRIYRFIPNVGGEINIGLPNGLHADAYDPKNWSIVGVGTTSDMIITYSTQLQKDDTWRYNDYIWGVNIYGANKVLNYKIKGAYTNDVKYQSCGDGCNGDGKPRLVYYRYQVDIKYKGNYVSSKTVNGSAEIPKEDAGQE